MFVNYVNPNAKIITLTGRLGSGKTTLLNKLKSAHPELNMIKNYTSRAKRKSENDYEFFFNTSKNYFKNNSEEFIDIVNVGEVIYGGKKSSYLNAAKSNSNISLLNTNLEALVSVEEFFKISNVGEDVFQNFYIHVKDEEVLKKRMSARGMCEADAEKRLEYCKSWYVDTKNSELKFVKINNSKNVKKAFKKIDEIISFLLYKQ